ncbi:MAG: leucine-rich repeat domain-containing protein, partial [Prevotella sp.]|nr:leucine-rich repeat domain-containing protein [Prevotella sp.]
ELPGGIKEIGIGVFEGCIKLQEITGFINLNITVIPENTFRGCIALKKIELPSGLISIGDYAFAGQEGQPMTLESISFGDDSKLQSIGNHAFYYCENITSIEITNNITIIGDNAFGKCSNLETLIYNAKNNESFASNAFSECPVKSMTIGKDVEVVPSELKQLTNINTIYYNAVNAEISISAETLSSIFAEFKNLTSFIIGETVKTIADYFLKNCVSIESLELPSSIESIGKGALHGCTGLKEIKGFGNLGITALPDSIFHGCTALESIELPGGIKEIGIGVFEGCISLKEVKGFVNLNITVIPDYTFHGCIALEQIELPRDLTSIGNYAFAGKDEPMALKSISFDNNSQLQSIGKYAFYYCENITSIKITNNITIIGAGAFANCTGLAEIYSFSSTPATCDGNEVFKGIPETCVLYVPAGMEKEYGEYSSSYSDTWNVLPKVRTFHKLGIAMEENSDVENNIEGYGYTTYYNGKYTYTLPAGMKAAVVKSSVSDFSDEIVPTMCWQYDGDNEENAVIPANTAVIIYGDVNDYMLMVDYDETATNADKYGVISSKGNVQESNFLYGCWDTSELYSDDTYTEGVTYAYADNGGKTVEGYLFYKLGFESESDGVCSNIGFYWAEDEGKPFNIAVKEVWLALPSSTGATKYLGFNYNADEDIAITDPDQSAINAIFSDQSTGDDRIYNLGGQRVNNMNQRGIYIVNGKKVAKTR